MSCIYEGVPSGFEGPANLLRSLPHPPSKAFVRFLNTTNVAVTVKWIDFDGNLKAYKTIAEHEYFDCDTFVDHAWVFKEFATNYAMCVNNKEVFWPKSYSIMVDGHPVPQRSTVRIHRPLLPLLTLAARAVRNRLSDITEPFILELPFHLQVLIVKLILEYWVAIQEKHPITPYHVAQDADNVIFRRDFNDFECNILFICHRLSMHAKKLLSLARRLRSHGVAGSTLMKTLETIIVCLGYDIQYDQPEMYTRKLAPVIWKQMIFLRVHLDNLIICCGPSSLQPNYKNYDSLLRIAKRRLHMMLPEHRNSIQQYHWEQLSLLVGNQDIKCSAKIKDDAAYDIPELIPLSQRKEWEWIDLRRRQLKDIPNRTTVAYFLELTSHMLRVTSKLENIFQVLCFFHYHLTGRHLTEEVVPEEENRTCDMES